MTWMKPAVSLEGWKLEGGVDGTMTCAGIQIYGG